MAKKKSNPQSDTTKHHNTNHQDDAASEKLHNLQSLNSLLLKETVERRQQVDSLTQANSSLESEITRCVSELNGLTEQAVKSEIEKGVAARFVEVQVLEMVEKIRGLERDLKQVVDGKNAIERVKNLKESEINSLNSRLSTLEGEIGEEKFILSRVCEERDEIRAQIEERIRTENVLRSALAESEKNQTLILEKSQKVKADYDNLVSEKKSIEAKMVLILKEKDSVEKNLIESNGIIDSLKMDMNKITKQKTVFEEDRNLQLKKINELQDSVNGLNELVQKLQQGKTKLLEKVTELEKKCAVSLDNEANALTQIDILVKEKQDFKVVIEKVNEEKSLVAKDLDEALNSLRKQNVNIGQLVSEKTKINDAKNQAETDVLKFKQQLEELENTVEKLEKQSIVQTDKVKQLESEKNCHLAASNQATKERNNAISSLDAEKLKVKHLSDTVSKMETSIEDMKKKLSKMQKETEKLVAEKKGLENKRQVLENDIQTVKKSLAKTQKEHDDTKGKLRLSEANTKQILKILKKTSLICKSKEDGGMSIIDKETEFGEGIKHHVTEVEAIKKVFKDKESVMDEMKKQVEQLKVRVAKADKGKSFWTMVSSATTFLAAVSLAYVARGGF